MSIYYDAQRSAKTSPVELTAASAGAKATWMDGHNLLMAYSVIPSKVLDSGSDGIKLQSKKPGVAAVDIPGGGISVTSAHVALDAIVVVLDADFKLAKNDTVVFVNDGAGTAATAGTYTIVAQFDHRRVASDFHNLSLCDSFFKKA